MVGSRFIIFAGMGLAIQTLSAQAAAPEPKVLTSADPSNPYAPFEYLIGDWHSKASNGGSIRQTFRWGTKRSFIYYTTLTGDGSGPEEVHFEGMLVWNGASRDLDYVIVLVPGTGSQEKGQMRVAEDGSLVRDVVMTNRDGAVANFRQTFRRTGPDSAITSLMRRTATGWEPNFPGSDRIEMVRRPA